MTKEQAIVSTRLHETVARMRMACMSESEPLTITVRELPIFLDELPMLDAGQRQAAYRHMINGGVMTYAGHPVVVLR